MIGPAPSGLLPDEDAELHAINAELAEWQRERQQQQAIGEYDAIYEYLRAKGEVE